MGTLSYGYPEHVCEIDDRTLAHLQIVIIDKLRRGETFCFTCVDGCARTTYWFSPGIPLRFGFTEPCRIGINRAWVAALELSAQTVQGLRVVEEPLGQAVAGAGASAARRSRLSTLPAAEIGNASTKLMLRGIL